jgi:Trk-type K+ transport system membrane component
VGEVVGQTGARAAAAAAAAAQLVLTALMFVGRLGPITLVSALALREKQLRYTLPEGRPLIG